jgi:CheY-like chemotaxis protein
MKKNSKTILVIDDEMETRVSLQIGLERGGWRVLTAKNAMEALAMLHAHDVNLIVMDLEMPGMNGCQACDRIREIWPHIPVIVLTAFSDKQHRDQAKRSGAITYLIKPISMVNIRTEVEAFLER